MKKVVPAFVGVATVVATVVALALPAEAHVAPTLTGKAVCNTATGQWDVSWVFANDTAGNFTFTITDQKLDNVSANVLSPAVILQGSQATGTLHASGSATDTTLKVTGSFQGEAPLSVNVTVKLGGNCEQAPAPVPPVDVGGAEVFRPGQTPAPADAVTASPAFTG
jgi:hypothetical protein